MHTWRSDELLILLAIRSECDATMEENFQVRPYFLKMLLAREFHDTYQYAEHPTRNTRNISHVLIHRLTGNAITLHLKVTQKSGLLLRYTHHIGKRIDILDENGTQVADQTARYIVVRRMATTEYQTLSIENLAFRIVAKIISHGIESTFIVNTMQSVS